MQYHFESFVRTRGTQRALAITRDLAAGGRTTPRLILLHGPTGIGKTHLLRAVSAEASPRPRRAITASDVVGKIIAGRTGWTEGEAGLLTVDDLHTLVNLPMAQQETGRFLENSARGTPSWPPPPFP